MLVPRVILVSLTFVTAVFAANTNAQVNDIIDNLDMDVHAIVPVIATIVANETISAITLQPQVDGLIGAFNDAGSGLANTPISDGSNNTAPTNDDISVTYGDVLFAMASILSAIDPSIDGVSGVLAPLDPAIANVTAQLNMTVPTSTNYVHILTLDARQFFQAKNFTQTLVSLGQPTS
ncbi:hypothetical protein K488DRAFT_49650 [Vararia minispora EC-137]|uniref:Uncharacterized protein n=1 Tax=Vararia minispora EC-137 TaxID=1314806 RepID=A0ACB8QL66_9AGAM|nr:hypothetical protein K488DRAFT_49650 [Vararia minispora EC-137]